MINRLLNKLSARFAIMAASLIATSASFAQTDPNFTHYYDVPTFYNPAAVGQIDFVRIRGGLRLQWLGIENAPTTIVGAADMPLKIAGKRIGIGAVVLSDKAGLYSTVSAALQIGYKLRLFGGELTVGLQPGMFNEAFKGSKVFIPDNDDYHQSIDEAIPTSDVAGTVFDLGAGLWYSRPKFNLGLSMTHIMSPEVKFATDAYSGETAGDVEGAKNFYFQARRTLYFTAAGNIPVKNTLFEVMPSMLFRSDFRFWNAEVTARARYNKFLTFGVGYRWDDAITAMIGVEFKGFYISYSFDYSTSAIMRASSGSHEIFAGYNLKLDLGEKNRHRHRSVRLM